jgi:hypothetical protein
MSKTKALHPHFFDDPNVDRLMTMVMNLAAEVSVLRERLDTHEQVAAEKKLFTPADIEAFERVSRHVYFSGSAVVNFMSSIAKDELTSANSAMPISCL